MASLIVLLWGFAEATIFFIIPDVFLSYVKFYVISLNIILNIYRLVV